MMEAKSGVFIFEGGLNYRTIYLDSSTFGFKFACAPDPTIGWTLELGPL
jgi:hypothetical protein